MSESVSKTIKFISDGDRFVAILTPRDEETENNIKALFSGIKPEELYKAEAFKDTSVIEDEVLPDSAYNQFPENESEQAQIFWCRYFFRKRAKNALDIFSEADNMFEKWRNFIAYRKAVAKELQEYSQYFEGYIKKIVLKMPKLFDPFVKKMGETFSMSQLSFNEIVEKVPPQALIDAANAAINKLNEN